MTAGIGVMTAALQPAAGLAAATEMYVIAIAPEAHDGDTYPQDSVGTMTAHTIDTAIARMIATMITDTEEIALGIARENETIRR